MVWKDIHKRRNGVKDLVLPLSWYKEEAEGFGWVNSVSIDKSVRLTSNIALGFVVRKPGQENPHLRDDFKILTASDNDQRTDRVVAIKELMHCCENDVAFQVNTKERLDDLFNHFFARPINISGTDLFIQSEPIAFWKAVALLTTEKHRLEIKADMLANPLHESMWATDLRVPEFMIDALISDRYELEVEPLLAEK